MITPPPSPPYPPRRAHSHTPASYRGCGMFRRRLRLRGGRWEGVEHVFGVVPRQTVEVEVERVEAGAEVAAFLFVPDEGLAVVADGREQL